MICPKCSGYMLVKGDWDKAKTRKCGTCGFTIRIEKKEETK